MLPVSITIFQPGANGAPTTTVLDDTLGARADDYSHSISTGVGFDAAQLSFACTPTEADQWLHRLMAGVVVSAGGTIVWEGYLSQVETQIGSERRLRSLKDVANVVYVRYDTLAGEQAVVGPVSDTGSIARYGTRTRVLPFSMMDSTTATNRASVALHQISWPKIVTSSEAGGQSTGECRVTLTFEGWAHALGLLTTSNTSTSAVDTHTQVQALITSYNATNPYFSTDFRAVHSTGITPKETIEADTPYSDAIARRVAGGTSNLQRAVFGVYEGRRVSLKEWAGASPSTITYFKSELDNQFRDTYGNIVPAWALRPDVMAQWTDSIEGEPPSGAVHSLTRKYIKRATCKIDDGGVIGTLEPDDDDTLLDLLSQPFGDPIESVGDRQQDITRSILGSISPYTFRTDNPLRYNGTTGVIKPIAGGTGIPNTGTITIPTDGTVDLGGGSIGTGGGSIDTGGGSITNPSGEDVDLTPLTPSGGGVLTPPPGGGTEDQLVKWGPGGTSLLDSGLEVESGADGGILAFYTGDLSARLEVIGRLNILGAGSGGSLGFDSGTGFYMHSFMEIDVAGAVTGSVLTYNASSFVWEAGLPGAYVGSGTAGQLTRWDGTGTALEDAGVIHSGTNILTIDTPGGDFTFTLANAGTLVLNGYTFDLTGDMDVNVGAATEGQALTLQGGIWKGADVGSIIGSGTAGFIAEWDTGGATLKDSSLKKTGSNVVTLNSTGGDFTFTLANAGTLDLAGKTLTLASNNLTMTQSGSARALTVAADGTVVVGTGTANKAAYWTGTNTVAASARDLSSLVDGSGTTGKVTYWADADTIAADSRDVSSLVDGSGTTNKIAYWTDANTIAAGTRDATALVDGSGTANKVAYWTDADTIAADSRDVSSLVDGSGTANKVAYWTDANTVAADSRDVSSLVDGSGTGGRVAQWSDADTIAAAALIMSGSSVLTLAASATATLTVPKTGTAALGTGTTGKVAYWTDANTVAADGKDVSSLVDGSGTGGRMAVWSDSDTITASTLAKGGAGVLTLATGSAYTANFHLTGDVVMGNRSNSAPGFGSGGLVAIWANEHEVGTYDNFTMSNGDLSVPGEIQTGLSVKWDLGGVGGTPGTATDLVRVDIGGTTYYLHAQT